VVTAADVRRLALALPNTVERLVRDRMTYRVGRLVHIGLSRDETSMGFAFPKQERAALVAAEPDKFYLPRPSEERYNWVMVRLAAIDEAELAEIVFDAWLMVAPKRVAQAYLAGHARPV
jgi:hypothetical protein